MEQLNSTDFTNEMDITNQPSHILMKYQERGEIGVISGLVVGTKDANNRLITLDRLFSSEHIPLSNGIISLNIPYDELMRRSKYQWFLKQTPRDIYDSNNFVSKMLLVAKGEMVNTQCSGIKCVQQCE